MKNKNLFKIGLLCGLIPLTFGLFIFFSWWAARAFFAVDLNSFVFLGVLWILISILVASIGFVLITIFLFKNHKYFLSQAVLGLILILINIPILYWVLFKQTEIESRAYIKIYNNTKQDSVEFKLKASDFEKKIGTLSDNETMVDFYYPQYIGESYSTIYPTIDTVTLIIKAKFTTHLLTLPRINKGECRRLYIDKEFKLLDIKE